MSEIKFDPVTRDWVRDGFGGFVRVEGSETMVMHALMIHFGEDPLDPESGSRLHNTALFTGDSGTLIRDEVRRALSVLVTRGEISNVSTTATDNNRGRVDVETTYRDVRTGQLERVAVTSGVL